MKKSKKKTPIQFTIGLGLIAVCLTVLVIKYMPTKKTPAEVSNAPRPTPTSKKGPALTEINVLHEIIGIGKRLEQSPTEKEQYEYFRLLKQYLQEIPREAATRAIIDYLESAEDTQTPLGFKISPEGFLKAAPSMRTFLLDQLGKINPLIAAEYSKVILTKSSSPDEWAIALRNLSDAYEEEAITHDPFFTGKVGELLSNESWLKDPTEGFLEAFDAAVFIGSETMVDQLIKITDSQNADPSVRFASSLALNRIAQENFEMVGKTLLSNLEQLAKEPEQRASIFARGDMRNERSLKIIQDYLKRPEISPEEIEAFAEAFPNSNLTYSNNLFSKQEIPTILDAINREMKAYEEISRMAKDPEFSHIEERLVKSKERLEEFLESADGGYKQRLEEQNEES